MLGLTQPQNEVKFETLLAKQTPPLVSEQVGSLAGRGRRPGDDRPHEACAQRGLSRCEQCLPGCDERPACRRARLALRERDHAHRDGRQAREDRRRPGARPRPDLLGRRRGHVRASSGSTLELRVKGDEIEATSYTPELPAEVPAGVSLFVDFKGLDGLLDEVKRSPALSDQIGTATKALGGVLDDVIALFKGEGALYARPGVSGPEYTLVLQAADEAAAASTLDQVATLASAFLQKVPEPVDIAGVQAKKIDLGTTTALLRGLQRQARRHERRERDPRARRREPAARRLAGLDRPPRARPGCPTR